MVEIQRILCPVDFSSCSERALDYAAAVAKWYGARLDVLHVHYELQPANVIPSLTPAVAAQLESRDREHVVVHEAATRFVERALDAGVTVDLVVRDEPDIDEAITEHARDRQVDLIVMGSHGRSGFERLVLGSVADRVMRTAPCPVLVVPPAAGDAAPVGQPGFDSILCALDFSDMSLVALEFALSLAQQVDADLTLFNVIEVPPELQTHEFAGPVNVNALRAEAEARQLTRLRQLIPENAREFCRVHTAVAEGSASREILREARERRSDLIVVAAHGRGVVDRLFFGSTASEVVRAAARPVLLVRPKAV